MNIYLDETTFGLSNEFSGYGCIFSDNEIELDAINEALVALDKDSDRHKPKDANRDSTTLSRKYFHATDDSPNAHSHLCDSINKYFAGSFHSHILNKSVSDISNEEDAYEIASGLSIVHAFLSKNDILFIFEERENLSKSSLEKWWQEIWLEAAQAYHRHPFIPLFYPNVNFCIEGKSNPGLQFVDFILWATGRKILEKNCPWYDRIKAQIKTEAKPSDKSWGGITFSTTFGANLATKVFYGPEDCSNLNIESFSEQDALDYLLNAQNLITRLRNGMLNPSLSHLSAEIEKCYAERKETGTFQNVYALSICFMRVFDNSGFINEQSDADNRSRWINFRVMASRIICLKGENMAAIKRIMFSDLRNKLIEHDSMSIED
jgi:hypothetical protein